MSVTIKQLNGDASFLLTFRSTPTTLPTASSPNPSEFVIILDPWLAPAPSDVMHRKFASSRQKAAPYVSSLSQLTEPDMVIVSQNMTDHCHKETLMQLPSHLERTTILGPKDAMETVKSWKHFNVEKIVPLRKWSIEKSERMYRIALPSTAPQGEDGEVTVTYVADRWNRHNMAKTHTAIAITYTPPIQSSTMQERFGLMTPPDTPITSTFSHKSTEDLPSNRPISIIFSPHGCNYSTLADYAQHRLQPLSALPLTALLHCFDEVKNTWYLGGRVCNGMQSGVEIAQKLEARVWISAHDGDKEVSGASIKQLKISKHEKAEVEAVVSPTKEGFGDEPATRAVILDIGEEIPLSNVSIRETHEQNSAVGMCHNAPAIGVDFADVYEDLDRIMLRR